MNVLLEHIFKSKDLQFWVTVYCIINFWVFHNKCKHNTNVHVIELKTYSVNDKTLDLGYSPRTAPAFMAR